MCSLAAPLSFDAKTPDTKERVMSKKRTVLITGASSGIGQAIAQLLAQKEFSVCSPSARMAHLGIRS